MKPVLPFVETMITQVCNLSCYGCTNYSDLTHKGYVTWEDGREQIKSWLERIDIPDFGIMGGEPLINPEVHKWISGTRLLMPKSQIRFTTNGVLLPKKIEIVDQLHDIGNCVFKITVHQLNSEIEEAIEYIMSKYPWQAVTEHGIQRFKTTNNFRFQINRPEKFLKTYRGDYANMMPHDNDQDSAFAICCQKTCPLLHKGKIYKCSTSGLLKETLERFNNPNIDQWNSYITDGISANCDQNDLLEFINNFGRAEKICRQCPNARDIESTVDHKSTVYLRKQ